MRYLVDTSVWIDYLNDTRDPHVQRLDELLKPPSPVVLTAIVLQEVLQGTRDEAAFRRYRAFFSSQPFIFPLDRLESYIEAASIYQRCRRAGVTIRSTIDCLIAQIVIEHDIILLHNDEDFRRIARIEHRLRETSG